MPRPVTDWTREWMPEGPRVPRDLGPPDLLSDPRAGIRDTQAEFATPDHVLLGTSLTARPDAVSLDLQSAHTLGPVAFGDTSEGLVARAWRARHEATPEGGRVWLERADDLNAAYEAPGLLLEYAGPPILEIDVAFEQQGQPVIVGDRATGADGAREVWAYWYDPTVPGYTFTALGTGRCPRCLLDDPVNPEDSDILIAYINDGFAGSGAVCFRQQRDRYAIEYDTPIVGGGLIAPATMDRGNADVGPITQQGVYNGVGVTSYFMEPVPERDGHGAGLGFTNVAFGRGDWQRPAMVLIFSEPITHFEAKVYEARFAASGRLIYPLTLYGFTEAQFNAIQYNVFYGGFNAMGEGPFPYNPPTQNGYPLTMDAPPERAFTHVLIWSHVGEYQQFQAPVLTDVFAGVRDRIGDPEGTPVQLPAIERLYIEDIVKARDNRVAVLFSMHLGSMYGLLSLVSTLYPFRGHPTEDAGAALPALAGDGELPVVIVDVTPDGDGDAGVVPAALALNGVLADPIINIGEAEIDPDGDAGAVVGVRGLNGVFEAAATLYDMTAMENDAEPVAVVAGRDGTLTVVVIQTSAYEPDTEGVRTVAALNGTLA